MKEVDLSPATPDPKYSNFRERYSTLKCFILMEPSKRQMSLNNLLQAFGITAEIVGEEVPKPAVSSIALVETSLKWLSVAKEIQLLAANCRCIVLINNASSLTHAEIRDLVDDPVFLTLPFTV